MSEDEDKRGGSPKVGYKRPPVEHRFRRGQSGNVKGRPRKKTADIDLGDVLDRPVSVTAGGKAQQMEPRKIALLAQLKKAQDGDKRTLISLLDLFAKHGALGAIAKNIGGGVIHAPDTMPLPMGKLLVEKHGPPPWTKGQIKQARLRYVERRTENEAAIDEAIGYKALLT